MKVLFFTTLTKRHFVICISVTACFLVHNAQAQLTPNIILQDTSSAIEERLVQLALQGPDVDKTIRLSKISEYQLKAAQNTWLNLLAFSINLNERSFASYYSPQAYVYPKYNLGISVPLGIIFSRTAVKSAKESILIGKDNTELTKRTIREQVIAAYKQYLVYERLITMQSELINDEQTQLVQTEEKFRKGTISIETYTTAQKNNNAELGALINLKLQQDLKKLELERLIGVKLETVIRK